MGRRDDLDRDWESFGDRISRVAGRFAARPGGRNGCCGMDDNEACEERSIDAGGVEGVRDKVVDEVASATGGEGDAVAGAAGASVEPRDAVAVAVVGAGIGGGISATVGLPREKRRKIFSAAGGAEAKTVPPSGEGPVGREISAGNFCKFGKRLVSAWSQEGTELLIRAADEGLSVAVVHSDKVLWGIPCRYGSYRSGFGLYEGGFLRDFGTTVRMVGGHRVEILSSDLVILASDVKLDAIGVCGVRDKTADNVAQVCGQNSGSLDYLDEETMERRVYDVGKFLYRVGQLRDEVVRCRVEAMLFPRVRDVINIVEKKMHELSLARFLRVFLGINRKSSLQSALNDFGREKVFPRGSDGNYSLKVAISYANAFLRNCVPSEGTKERGTTFMDHGAVVQIREAEGAEKYGCAFLPDLKGGDSGSHDALFSWHSDIKDSVLPKLDTFNDRMLVSALLFQYYGVPLSDLVIVCHNGDILQIISAVSRRLSSVGLRVIIHNGIAVLGKLGEPATLLADSTDAKAYSGRFASEINCPVEEAERSYEDLVKERIMRKMQVVLERSRREVVNGGIRAFVRAVKRAYRDPVRIKALVDAFVFDKKEAVSGGETVPEPVAADSVSVGSAPVESAPAESLAGLSVAEISIPVEPVSKPDWIEVVEEVTSELREVHGFAEDAGSDRLMNPGSHSCYFHGKLLLLALAGMYHGVSRDVIEGLPFYFRTGRDSNLNVVIGKVNAVISGYGIRVRERGGVLILGPDVAGEGRKVQILGKKLPVHMYPKNLVVKLLRRKKTFGVDESEEVVDDADAEVSACGLGAVDGECAAINGVGVDDADVSGTDDSNSEGVAGNAAVSAGASDETGDKSC